MMATLNFFKCSHCEKHLDAYLDHRLTPRLRRRVARHLDECPRCYLLYIQRRDLQQELQRALPLVGRRDKTDFQRLWGGISAELPRTAVPNRMRYGLVAMALMVMFLLPFTMAHRDVMLSPTIPAAPETLATQTPESTAVAEATVAASLTDESDYTPATSIPTIPQPGTTASARGN